LFSSVNYLFIYVFYIYLILNLKLNNIYEIFFNFTLSSLNIFNLLKIFLILIFLLCLIIISHYYKIEKYLRFEFFYILGLSFFGMLLLLLSNDLIIMFLSLELQTFGLYILLGIQQKRL
jgi:NADH-quinone oxidoreductase subunit N